MNPMKRRRFLQPAALARRLHEWRSAMGAETRWNRELGHAVLASHALVLDWTRARLFGEAGAESEAPAVQEQQ